MLEKDYGEYEKETTVIQAFEEYAKRLEEEEFLDIGTDWEDFGPWYMCFRAGFEAGGSS